MKKKEIFITKKTIQPCSWASLNESEDSLNINKPGTEDDMSLLLEVFDSLNELNEVLVRLDYVIQRKSMEAYIYRKCKEEKK
jgi:hypothetical protein